MWHSIVALARIFMGSSFGPTCRRGGGGGAREVDGGPKYSFAELMSSPTHPRWVYYNHVGACF